MNSNKNSLSLDCEVKKMKITGIIRRVDDLGRIVIPKEIRRQVFGKTDASGEPMEIFIDGENIMVDGGRNAANRGC